MCVGKRPLDKQGQFCAGCSLHSWQVCSSLLHRQWAGSFLCCCSLKEEPGTGGTEQRQRRARSPSLATAGEPGLSHTSQVGSFSWGFVFSVCRTQDGSVFFWATPRQVSSLQHLCRMAIRRVMPTSQVKNLPIPSKVVEFLCYQIWVKNQPTHPTQTGRWPSCWNWLNTFSRILKLYSL